MNILLGVIQGFANLLAFREGFYILYFLGGEKHLALGLGDVA